ncbi:MAG: sn-glycerol-3-phosphate ABC transporter ATP-binding protein UgpC [Deltaproteobacteria bacterium]|nr:sn-glycerol-3-phosphate ABC transporter ATP-binding protein UgpC [Deltaproteobacteria bacterium]
MAQVILQDVRKSFGKDIAVDRFSLTVRDREFMVLVGPSGCGKSTTLKMIAGLEDITAGEIYIGDRLVNRVPPKNRDVAMVFQNYALYPHMSVFENMAFGLKLKKMPRKEIEHRVKQTAEMLGISQFLDRKPKVLSGGQRQRVALGRAIVRVPQVYLFDEPLSNLDAKLRIQMRLELKKLHERMERTSIYVTHDQIEAMTMGDRIVVMKDGLIQQVGAPLELYFMPTNRFVASFIGSPTMNFVRAHIEGRGNNLVVASTGLELPVPEKKVKALSAYRNREVILGIRPDDLSATGTPGEKGALRADVVVVQPVGSQIYLEVKVGGHSLIASVNAQTRTRPRREIILKTRLENLHFFDPATEKAIYQPQNGQNCD